MLDCETELGKLFIEEQYRTQDRLAEFGFVVINTPGKVGRADVMLAKQVDGRLEMYGLAEIKSRLMAGNKPITRQYLRDNGGYLISNSKLKFGQQASTMYNIPFFVIVSIMEENVILIWKITDSSGAYTEEHETKQTSTKSTVNGGVSFRMNSFLSMDSKHLTTIE